ncbi:MAG: YjfB family protein [Oscillospiraceae bacterium]|nr:YjfB family protein [Oscillospiraceae bacterium]
MDISSAGAIPGMSIEWSQMSAKTAASTSVMKMAIEEQSDMLSTLLKGVEPDAQAMQLSANPNVGSMFDMSV